METGFAVVHRGEGPESQLCQHHHTVGALARTDGCQKVTYLYWVLPVREVGV